MQFNTKASRRKTKNQKGKKELKYRVERLFLSISKWLPPIIECILPLISSCPQLANFAKMIQNTTSVIPAKSPDAAQPRLPSRALLWGSSSIQCNRALLANGPARAKRWQRCSHSFQVLLPCFLSKSSQLVNCSTQIKGLTAKVHHGKEEVPQINLPILHRSSSERQARYIQISFFNYITSIFLRAVFQNTLEHLCIVVHNFPCMFTITTLYPIIIFHFINFKSEYLYFCCIISYNRLTLKEVAIFMKSLTQEAQYFCNISSAFTSTLISVWMVASEIGVCCWTSFSMKQTSSSPSPRANYVLPPTNKPIFLPKSNQKPPRIRLSCWREKQVPPRPVLILQSWPVSQATGRTYFFALTGNRCWSDRGMQWETYINVAVCWQLSTLPEFCATAACNSCEYTAGMAAAQIWHILDLF